MNVKKIFAERPMIKGNYIDTGLLVAIILLWGLGLMILYVCSAEYGVKAFSDSQYFIRRQLIMSGMGLVVMIVAFLVPQSFIRRCLPFIVGGTFVLCVLPFLPGIGSPRNGAHRWISLPFFGDTFQPSELVKIAVVLFIANWFDKFIKTPEDKTRSIFPPVFMLCVFSGIVMFQDDFSTSLLIFVLGFLVMFVAGARLGGLVPFIVLAGLTMLLFVFTSTFRVNRLIAFLNPNFDTHGSNYQTVNARTAISDGGFLGNGFGEGLDKINFVPNINVYFANSIEEYAEVKQRENGELYINVTEQYYDNVDNFDYRVFLTKEDYDTYLEMVEYDNEVERINNYKSTIEWHKRKLEKINKLISEL